MGSAAPSPSPPSGKNNVRSMLILFAVVAILGVFTLAFSVVIGIVLLIIAEVFFAVAYRRFSKRPRPAS